MFILYSQMRQTRVLLSIAWALAFIAAIPQLFTWRAENVYPDWPGGWVQCIQLLHLTDKLLRLVGCFIWLIIGHLMFTVQLIPHFLRILDLSYCDNGCVHYYSRSTLQFLKQFRQQS